MNNKSKNRLRTHYGGALFLLSAFYIVAGTAWAQDQNAFQTRQQLSELMRRYPPMLVEVLRLDPSLLNSKEYLAPYPELAAYLSKHQEIAHDPSFFLGSDESRQQDLERERRNGSRELRQSISAFVVFVTIAGALLWILKSFIEYRRWLRITRSQHEVHTKLMDRFTASEDLLNYIQTPAGKRFLESAPISLDAATQTPAPVSRILWSVQVGLVLGLGGLGMNYASSRLEAESGPPFYFLGILCIALGIGFVLSAITSYLISRRMGLFGRPAEPPPAWSPHNE